MKPRRSVFLGAAKRLHAYSQEKYASRYAGGVSPYACDCIEEAQYKLSVYTDTDREKAFFAEMFEPPEHKKDPNGFGWWKSGDSANDYEGHDYESRLLALLLCWAMLEPKKRRAKARIVRNRKTGRVEVFQGRVKVGEQG
jgi:hypothetical protein